jgi:hypothetical protein
MTQKDKIYYDKWMTFVWPKGTKVKMYDLDVVNDSTTYVGEGFLTTDFIPIDENEDGMITEDEAVMHSPEILTEGGKIIQGSECWWIPEEVLEHHYSEEERET